MILKKLFKQPGELKDYDIDYSPWLTPISDTLDNVDISIEVLDSLAIPSMVLNRHLMTEDTLKLWIEGGSPGEVYKVTISITTVGGRIDESELIFAVEDI